MKATKSKKLIIILAAISIILTGAYFVLGGYGQSGPDAAPNLDEYGLVGYWNFEEGTGQTVFDRSGNSNNGTLGASTSVAKDDPVFTSGHSSSGPGGTGLEFDGVDDYVDAGVGSSLNITDAITIEAWIYRNGNVGYWDNIVSKMDYGAGNRPGYDLDFVSNNYLRFMSKNVESISNSPIPNQTWTYVAGVYNGTNIIMYINGILQTSQPSLSGGLGSATSNLIMGRLSYGTTTGFLSGSIDEVRIYNRALSAEEVRQHYNQKKPVLEWKFDEGSGTAVRDESFNNNDGTLHE